MSSRRTLFPIWLPLSVHLASCGGLAGKSILETIPSTLHPKGATEYFALPCGLYLTLGALPSSVLHPLPRRSAHRAELSERTRKAKAGLSSFRACSHPKSTSPNSKSTVDLGCERLIRVEKAAPTRLFLDIGQSFCLITTRHLKRANRIQTATHQKIYPASSVDLGWGGFLLLIRFIIREILKTAD